MDDYKQDLKEGARIMRKAAPILKDLFLQTNLFTSNVLIQPIEEQRDSKVCKLLDNCCGIDYIVFDDTQTRAVGLAWRTNRFWKARHYKSIVYNGFSLRQRRDNQYSKEENCEIQKRQTAIELGLMRPEFTAQADYDPDDDDEILCVAIARTDDVIDAHNKGMYRICDKNRTKNDVFMHDVQWEAMKQAGYPVYDWYAKDKYKGLYEPCVCDTTSDPF